MRILTWIYRFINNSRKIKKSDLLTTEEIDRRRKYLIKQVQREVEHSEKFIDNQKRLNLHKNQEGIYEFRGRIEGAYPVYIPSEPILNQNIISSGHKSTLHGGVTMTMTKVRSQYWIPTLRNLVTFIIRNCRACKKYQATAYPDPPKPELLTKDRTEQCLPFQVISVDYAGPIFYRSKTRKYLKEYILLFSCSGSRAVYLELVPNLTTSEFIRCLKRLIARRGRPKIIYCGVAKSFIARAKLLQKINKDKK